MNLVLDVVAWFGDPANWTGSHGALVRMLQHLYATVLAVLIAALIAVPVGALVGHTGRGGFLVVGGANGLRALPELGLLILLVLFIGVELTPLVIALVVLGVPPLLAGTYAGVRNVDPTVVDAARGMGMREHQVLLRVELPVALPLILGGLRAATLQVIATAAIGAVIAQQNLGRYIIDGLALKDFTQMVAGALLIAALALATEGALALVTRGAVSPGLRAVPDRARIPRPRPSSVPAPAGGTP